MAKIRGTYEYDDDDLTPGQKKEGGLHQNLFDSAGKLKGSARFTPDAEQAEEGDASPEYFDPVYEAETTRELTEEERQRERERDENAELIAKVFVHLLAIATAKAKPHFQRFLNDKARPAIQAKWENRPRLRRADRQLNSSRPSVVEMKASLLEEHKDASAEYRQNMTSSEAQTRVMMAMFLRALSDEQLDIVANADVVLDEGYEELERKLAVLPPQQVTYMIESLMADPSLIADQLLGFEKLLGLPPSDGEHVVIEGRREP